MRRSGSISPAPRGSGARSSRPWKPEGGRTMGEYVIKLPDVGEGVAEAELVEWHVKI
ncbi:MAG: 2-oxo acid dehydrogenase subunit E2, partial [Mesorhizobium sp.]